MRISDWSSDVCSSDLLHDHPDQLARRLLDVENLEHVLGRQRFEIEPVGRVVIGANRLRVAIDHDRLEASILQRKARMAADRKSVVWGKSVSVRVALGGRVISKKKNN